MQSIYTVCMYIYIYNSPTLRTALDQIPENFVAVSIAKATNNVTLICKRFLPRA